MPQDMRLISYVKHEPGWVFILTLSHILFWVYGARACTRGSPRSTPSHPNPPGVTAGLKYGYTDTELDDGGSIPSGPSGSGVLPVTGMLTAVGTAIVLYRIAVHDPMHP